MPVSRGAAGVVDRHPQRDLAAAIERIPRALFRPAAAVYWTDLLCSALVGWTAFSAAAMSHGAARVLLFTVSAFLLYRATLFIHELTHLSSGQLKGFNPAWNILVGIPVLLPSFLYEGVHLDHHRPQLYGTSRDPEYVPFAHRSPWQAASFVVGAALLPIALVVRFGVLAPLSWLVPALRTWTLRHGSSLVINRTYVRQSPIGRAGRVQEAACAVLVWTVGLLWLSNIVSSTLVMGWVVVIGTASVVNAVRTLAAHRYGRDERELTAVEQLLDSRTLAPLHQAPGLGPADLWNAVWAPVGLRFHALHHWIPSLPYHNLGRVDRLLVETLPPDAAYHQTRVPTIAGAIADLIGRARAR